MANGNIYIAYTQGNFACGDNLSSCVGRQFLTSQATPPPDAGVDDAGAPPHYFGAGSVPYQGVPVQPRDKTSMAVDSNGKPGIALFQEPGTGGAASYNTTLMYWQPGMASAAAITNTNNVQNDNVVCALQFEGTKPRIVADMVAVASPTSYLLYVTSNDGTTWSQPIAIPEDNSASNDTATRA